MKKNKSKSKKICFIIPGYVTKNTGGAELQVYFLTEELLKRGWKVELITFYGNEKQIKQSPYYNSKINYHYYKEHTIRSLEFWGVLKQLFKTSCTYYYQRTDYAHTGAVALYCKLFNKKMIYALAQDGETTKNRYTNSFNPKKYKNRVKAILRKTDLYFVDKSINYGKQKAHLRLSQTQTQKELLLKNLQLDSTYLPNSFIHKSKKKYFKENIIVWVANFRPEKQAHLFLKLAEETSLKDWKFIMIGHIDQQRDKITIEAIRNIKKPNFQHLGALPYKEAEEWIQKAKILLNTSSEEGFSNAFIQAFLYNTLLISLTVDPDNIIERENIGFCFNSQFHDLKKQLPQICNNYQQHLPMIDKAHQYAIHNFSIKRNVSKLEQYLQNI